MLCGVVGKYGLPDKLFQPVSPVVLQPGRGRFCKSEADQEQEQKGKGVEEGCSVNGMRFRNL
jgi:hypothetical protein